MGRDQVADQQWQAEFDEAIRQFNYANGLGEFASAGGSGGGGTVDSSWLNADGTVDVSKIKKNSQWWQEYAERNGLDTETGKYKTTGGNGSVTETEEKMDEYVRNMLNNARSSQFNPEQVIKANGNLTKEERETALEILDLYISSGAMKTGGKL